ncbi:hypothetical protein D9M72_422240 [compost metagenome]
MAARLKTLEGDRIDAAFFERPCFLRCRRRADDQHPRLARGPHVLGRQHSEDETKDCRLRLQHGLELLIEILFIGCGELRRRQIKFRTVLRRRCHRPLDRRRVDLRLRVLDEEVDRKRTVGACTNLVDELGDGRRARIGCADRPERSGCRRRDDELRRRGAAGHRRDDQRVLQAESRQGILHIRFPQ